MGWIHVLSSPSVLQLSVNLLSATDLLLHIMHTWVHDKIKARDRECWQLDVCISRFKVFRSSQCFQPPSHVMCESTALFALKSSGKTPFQGSRKQTKADTGNKPSVKD